MSSAPRRHSCRTLAVLFCLTAGLALPLVALGGDDLAKFRARQTLEAQQAVADVKAAIDQSRKLENRDPEQAKLLLRNALTRLQEARGVEDSERGPLLRQLRARIAEVDVTLREREVQTRIAADADAKKRLEDFKQPQSGQSDPKSPFNKAKDLIGSAKDTLDKYKSIRDLQGKGTSGVLIELDRTAAIMEEKRFPENWDKIVAKRGPKLTKEEKELLQMLNSTLSVNFDKTPLKDVIEYIQDKAQGKLPIFFDKQSLDEAMVDYDSPVTFKVKKATVRTILKKILADRGLTYMIKEAALHVMTPEKAREFLVVRTYPIQDLVTVMWGPYLDRFQTLQRAQQIMAMIVTTIDPPSWQINGGMCTIAFDEARMALVIRAPAEMHYQLGSGLGR